MARITETINLPSNGKLYDIKEVTIQNMTVAEEKFLYGSSDSEKAINKILKACIVDENINVDDLIVPDKFYILLRLRVLTYGADYPIDVTCPHCRARFTENLDLSTLEVDELADDFEYPIEMTLPVTKDVIKYALPTGAGINKYNKLAKNKADRYKLNFEEVSYIYRMMIGIISVNDEELLDDELYTYISELPAKDSSYIKHEVNKINVGYVTTLAADCTHCGEEVNFRLPMSVDFFLTDFND